MDNFERQNPTRVMWHDLFVYFQGTEKYSITDSIQIIFSFERDVSLARLSRHEATEAPAQPRQLATAWQEKGAWKITGDLSLPV